MRRAWMTFFALALGACNAPEEPAVLAVDPAEPVTSEAQALAAVSVEEIERDHCPRLDEPGFADDLDADDLAAAVRFCALPTAEKQAEVKARFEKRLTRTSGVLEQASYSCTDHGRNRGIPSQADLGVSGGRCSWTDPHPECSVEQGVACLWGCTNPDPTLGWEGDTHFFESKAAAEDFLFAKGYKKLGRAFGGDYGRQLSYGYRYQVTPSGVDANGRGNYHTEGPEPSPSFSFYSFFRGWWPTEVKDWHEGC